MEYLEVILTPLILIMRFVIEILYSVSGSFGLSIVGLSMISSILMLPVVSSARRREVRSNQLQEQMSPLLEEIRVRYVGRERFDQIEELYRAYGYHPIKSLAALLPLMVQLPLVIAAFLLLKDYAPLDHQSFLIIRDLSEQDALIQVKLAAFQGSINLLPILVIAIALIDSGARSESTPSTRRRFLLVSGVLAVLIYGMPSAVCLYWLVANVSSLVGSIVRRLRLKVAQS